MELKVQPGLYVLAVSGGVDSMVLLDLLSKMPQIKLVAAHFNHGIRAESAADERFVSRVVQSCGLPLEVGYGRLGPKASEDAARRARYDFLESVRRKYNAHAIVTAHHQDDLIETAILNILRGTGAQGLVSIRSNRKIVRPMLGTSKAEIIKYAQAHEIKWVEDKSNSDTRYARNHVRHNIVAELTLDNRQDLIHNLDKVADIQIQKRQLIATLSRNIIQNDQINRSKFVNLPAAVSDELVHSWFADRGRSQTTRREVKRVSNLLKTAKPGRKFSVSKELSLEVGHKTALLRTRG